MNWHAILAVLAAIGLIGITVYVIRSNPDMFSAEKMSKSFSTIGFLTLGLIAFIAMLVFLLKR